MLCCDKIDGTSSLFEDLRVLGSPQLAVDLSLVSLGCSSGSESFHGCPHSESSIVSENSRLESPNERTMSPVNGFKLRMTREESELSESALSSVPTVIQSQRRILVPKPHHASPLRPMRLFCPIEIEKDPENLNSTISNTQDTESARRLNIRAMSRHLRQQKRDATDHPGRRPFGEVLVAAPDQILEMARGNTCEQSHVSLLIGPYGHHKSNRNSSQGNRSPLQQSSSRFRNEFFNFVQS